MRALCVIVAVFISVLAGCGGGGGSDAPVYEFGLAFMQYRVFENTNVGNRYQAYLPMTKDGKAINETDISDIRIYGSGNNALNTINDGFNAETYMYLNCMVEPCSQNGPLNDNGFYGSFSSLSADTYSFEVDTADGQTLPLDIPYPGQLVLPFVSSSTMEAVWVGSDLELSWTNPTGSTNWSEVDQLRIRIFDGTGAAVLYLRLNSMDEMVSINGSLLNQAAGLGNGILTSWEVQTRAYNDNNMNFARAYSNRASLPAQTTTCTGELIDPIALTIGAPLSEMISPFGTKFYIFNVVDPATYTISLYNMTTDNDWTLIEYVSNCEDDYPDPPPILSESSSAGTNDDIRSVSLSLGLYLLIVDEFDNLSSSYTVSVTR